MGIFDRFSRKKGANMNMQKKGNLHYEPVEKNIIPMPTKQSDNQKRGIAVLDSTSLFNISAKDKSGRSHKVSVEDKYVRLSPQQKLEMYEKCPPVLGVVTSRANRISTLDYSIVPIKSIEDEIVYDLKSFKEIFEENNRPGFESLGKRLRAYQEIRRHLDDVFPDLSNFDASLRRWRKRLKMSETKKADQISEFFAHPAPGVLWTEFIKKIVQDLMVQGSVSIYKKEGNNLYVLPGGSVFPVQGEFVGSSSGYVQIPMFGGAPQLFFNDEVAYSQYMPNSNLLGGVAPLEALVNLVAENLLFNEMMAERADGSETPKKVVVFGGGDAANMSPGTEEVPLDADDQARVEQALNKKRREMAVKVISGYGTPAVLDLSKADTIPSQLQRQDKIDKYVAMVFNASNNEINQTGGDGTSGRSTSETQERSDNAKGVRPLIKIIEEMFTHEIIPQAFGYGWKMVFSSPRSDEELVELAGKKIQYGLADVNEVRVEDLNKEAYPEPEFDRPQAAKPPQPATVDDIQGLLQ